MEWKDVKLIAVPKMEFKKVVEDYIKSKNSHITAVDVVYNKFLPPNFLMLADGIGIDPVTLKGPNIQIIKFMKVKQT